MKMRRRYVEVAKSTHCHLGRAAVNEHVEKAVRTATDDSKIEVTRKGGCVTIRTFEHREVPELGAPAASSEPLGMIMTLADSAEPKVE